MGVKRTFGSAAAMSANDSTLTFASDDGLQHPRRTYVCQAEQPPLFDRAYRSWKCATLQAITLDKIVAQRTTKAKFVKMVIREYSPSCLVIRESFTQLRAIVRWLVKEH
jgi:hypothetical protein